MESPVLKTIHNAGFFSCCTIRLIDIMKYFNRNQQLPEVVDSTEQFAFYKKELSENIIPELFEEKNTAKMYQRPLHLTHEPKEVSFSDYSKLVFEDAAFFVDKYFAPSARVRGIMDMYLQKYGIDFTNTCAVFYRGNDKQRECEITPYSAFIEKAKELEQQYPGLRFLVQPDETEFLEAFTAMFPGKCIYFSETPHMRKMDSTIFYQLPPEQKTEHGCNFLAAVITLSKCQHLITHSGNGGLWAILYRGDFTNVHQFMVKRHIY
jgi:hypothetical protein